MAKKQKQEKLPGTTDKRDPELVRLADDYVEYRDARMAEGKRESEAKQKLLAAMEERKLTSWHDPDGDIVITVETETKLKVKKPKDDDDDDADAGDV